MAATPLNQPQLLALGVGALILVFGVLWVAWKIGKWVIQTAVGLLVLAGIAAALWWLFTGH